MKLIKYPSINQFRHVVKNVTYKASFQGLDENDEPILKQPESYPTLIFEGTVKLHGTNASVVLYPDGKLVYQSRRQIITPEKDNAGFAQFAHYNKDLFIEILESLRDNDNLPIAIFGEWCGSGIQKGVAISELEKMFVVFGVKVIDEKSHWIDFVNKDFEQYHKSKIYSIHSFNTFFTEIDFNKPELSQNVLIGITEQVEAECPVGKHFGVSGIGEGVVWRCIDEDFQGSDFMMKVKGEKHSVSKVKTLANVDIENVKTIQEFVERTVTKNRIDQAVEILKQDGKEVSQKSTGDLIRWVIGDVSKEESDTLFESGLTIKDVGKDISTKAKNIFFKILDDETFAK